MSLECSLVREFRSPSLAPSQDRVHLVLCDYGKLGNDGAGRFVEKHIDEELEPNYVFS